jgi:hypothetical protein
MGWRSTLGLVAFMTRQWWVPKSFLENAFVPADAESFSAEDWEKLKAERVHVVEAGPDAPLVRDMAIACEASLAYLQMEEHLDSSQLILFLAEIVRKLKLKPHPQQPINNQCPIVP